MGLLGSQTCLKNSEMMIDINPNVDRPICKYINFNDLHLFFTAHLNLVYGILAMVYVFKLHKLPVTLLIRKSTFHEDIRNLLFLMKIVHES